MWRRSYANWRYNINSLTLGTAKAVIGRVEGVCQNSAKITSLLNEAQQRLLNRADKPVGSFVIYKVCAGSTNCLSWPRQVRTIEAFAICKTPAVVRSSWFEFIGYPNGPGLLGEDSVPGTMLVDRGTSCAFDDVIATTAEPRRIAAIAANLADVGKKITLRYINSSGQKVYSSIGGVVQEGEQLTLVSPNAAFPSNAAVTSADVATQGLYAVIKEVTQYPVYLYEYDPTVPVDQNSITKMLAQYEPSEQVPIYRRSFVPGLTDWSACDSDSDADCTENKQLTALVRLQHVPVVVDNDPLVIGNLAALKLMVMAIMREESNRLEESAIFEAKARAELDGELSAYLGDGMRTELKVSADFGAGVSASGWSMYW